MKDRVGLPVIGVVSALLVLGVGVVLLSQPGPSRGHPDAAALPALNAFLNGMSALLLTAGYLFIRRKKVTAHKICMVSAFGVSSLFLVSYLAYHYQVGSVPFGGTGWVRAVYFPLLGSHVALAALIVPLALGTIYRAWNAQFDRHVRIARWALPLWLYVSVTGVIVYWMLHRFFPGE